MEKMPAYRTATVRVPATSANMGPGFDALGMALSMWNRLRVRWGGPARVVVHGRGEGELPADATNLTYRAAQRVLDEYGAGDAGLTIESWQEIPLSSGLGSSSSAIVGGMFAANALLGFPADLPRLLELAMEMEGHPDNVAPALVGGVTVAVRDGERVYAAPLPAPDDLQCVALVPDVRVLTAEARAVLAPTVSRADAVYNIGRAALLAAALTTNHPEYLRVATQDRLHQQARERVFPAMKHVFRNAMSAGARGVYLSGAGPSVVALTTREERRAQTIGYEMADAADKAGVGGTFYVLEPANTGAQVLALGVEGP
ncbi:MAG: homoserine kinase [Dehalococcoidia bacterium]|nr:homoserine kinase [Dehalococcoidia bacterium]